MSGEFKAGDVVRLKSGGPNMTIVEIYDGGNEARCEWFDDKKVPQMRDFALSSLKHKPPPSGPMVMRF